MQVINFLLNGIELHVSMAVVFGSSLNMNLCITYVLIMY